MDSNNFLKFVGFVFFCNLMMIFIIPSSSSGHESPSPLGDESPLGHESPSDHESSMFPIQIIRHS